MINFTLRQLAIFDAIVRAGSLSAAAEDVGVSQSAASMSLKELEAHLGMPLFHRKGRKLILNNHGKRLKASVRSILSMAQEISKPRKRHQLDGVLRVAVTPTLGDYVLPQCMVGFMQDHPGVQIELLVGNLFETVDAVDSMAADIGILTGICNRNSLMTSVVGEDDVVVFASPSHRLAQQESVSADEMRVSDLCLRPGPSPLRLHLSQALFPIGMPSARILANSYDALKAAVAAGLGLGFASRHVIASDVAAGRLKVLDAPGINFRRPFTAIVPKNVLQSDLLQAFTAHMRNWFLQEGGIHPGTARDDQPPVELVSEDLDMVKS